LRSALDAFEHDIAIGNAVADERLAELRTAAIRRGREHGQMHGVRRLAALVARAGRPRKGLALLKEAAVIAPEDLPTAQALSDALASQNRLQEALEALTPGLKAQPPDLSCLKRALRLHHQVGQFEQALQLAQLIPPTDERRRPTLLMALQKAGREEEALAMAREILASDPDDLRVCDACHKILFRLGAEQTEIARARAKLVELAGTTESRRWWKARLLEREGDISAAIAETEKGLAEHPDDTALLRKRADYVFVQGELGRDAGILLKAREIAPPFSEVSARIAQADSLLRSFNGSLELAAQMPDRFAHVRTPEIVFERATRSCPAPREAGSRSGIVMIVGSLGGYGAERIIANTFRLLASQRPFGWTKLYVSDFARRTSEDFYSPLAGIPDSEVVPLNQDCPAEPPLSWLDSGQAQVATRILERLRQDHPAVVHASLDPLNVFAGLSALLAGVPRIVLHTHNMRPTELAIKNAPRLRGCYRALMSRPEVTLVGCAQACIEDYAEWLQLDDRSKTRVVLNGFDFEEIIAAGQTNSREELQAEHGIEPGTTVIGTAIRFADSKQPLLWVDAAAEILERRPDCRFVMFGDGNLRRPMEDHIRAKGLTPYFVLPGRVADIYRRLPLLDLFMLSSRTEGLPNSLIEAQAAGVAVIATNVGGVRETMIPGVSGLLVEDCTPGALAAAALGALRDCEWRRNAASAGREFVCKTFTTERMLNALLGVFRGDLPDMPGLESGPA
jgi:glycosyltransferase involved in cell wall biosynthesis